MHAVISHRSSGRPLTVEGGIVRVADALDMARAARASSSRPGAWTSTRSPPTPSTRCASRPATTRRCASRSRCPTARASSRSTKGSARSCAARRWPSTSRSSPGSRASTKAPRARLPPVTRALAWQGVEEWLAEHAQVDVLDDGVFATGVQLGVERALPCRLPPRCSQRLDHAAAGGRESRRRLAPLAETRTR